MKKVRELWLTDAIYPDAMPYQRPLLASLVRL